MLTYIPYSLLFYIIHGINSSPVRNNLHAVSYLKFHAICSSVSHTVSIWLTVSVALLRYIYLSSKNGQKFNTLHNVYIIIGAVVAFSTLLNLPQFLVLQINKVSNNATSETWYYLDTTGMREHQGTIKTAQYIITAVLVKIGPGLLLILLSVLLIRFLVKAQSRYQRMRQSHSSCDGSTHVASSNKKRQEQTNQTTRLLIAVSIVFSVAELPQGCLYGLSALEERYELVYWLLGNFFDLLTMISCAVNFVLYCSMSAQFRKIFMENLKMLQLHVLCCQQKPLLSPQSSVPTEHVAVRKPSTGGSISLSDVSQKTPSPEHV